MREGRVRVGVGTWMCGGTERRREEVGRDTGTSGRVGGGRVGT
jgi:hypothetical protein